MRTTRRLAVGDSLARSVAIAFEEIAGDGHASFTEGAPGFVLGFERMTGRIPAA
jgi:hypothetical protein